MRFKGSKMAAIAQQFELLCDDKCQSYNTSLTLQRRSTRAYTLARKLHPHFSCMEEFLEGTSNVNAARFNAAGWLDIGGHFDLRWIRTRLLAG